MPEIAAAAALSDLPAPVCRTAGAFEKIPKWLNLFPMVAQWLWLGIQYRSLTLPSAANPFITTGGMVGEGKQEYFNSMGLLARSATAPYITVRGGEAAASVLQRMETAKIFFPVVAKPDIGWCGYGVRLVANERQLEDYSRAFPEGETFLIQKFIADKGEAGLFYARAPDVAKGDIIGILLRYFPQVTGDGVRCVAELVKAQERLIRLTNNSFHDSDFDGGYIPAAGQTVRLALIGSTRVGGLYLDGSAYATPRLLDRLEEIARDMQNFHVGRFDVRYETLDRLMAGDFTIIEVNGAGSEAVHAWDPKYNIPEVYRIVFAKQRTLFSIGAACRRAGHRPCGFFTLARHHLRQQLLIRRYPLSN